MQVSKRLFELETESAFAILAKANKLISEGKDIINLGIGQPDFSTPQNILEAAHKAIKDGHHGYTPSNGILPLREAVSDFFRSLKLTIAASTKLNVSSSPSAKGANLFLILSSAKSATQLGLSIM